MEKKHYDSVLSVIAQRQSMAKKDAQKLLKDYIRENGPIDCCEEVDMQLQTTFYCEGYFAAKVLRVYIDEGRGLVIDTDEFDYDEHSDAFTNDTLLDILCSVAF